MRPGLKQQTGYENKNKCSRKIVYFENGCFGNLFQTHDVPMYENEHV
jgi:hypothetical protein